MLYNNDQIFKEKYSKLNEDEKPIEDDTNVEDNTIDNALDTDLENDPVLDNMMDDSLESDDLMLDDNTISDLDSEGVNSTEPILSAETNNYSLTEILEKLSTWNNQMDEYLDYCIKGAELINNELAREDVTYITKEQVTSFGNLLETCKEVFLSVNDVSFDADKLVREIDLSKKILLTQKESVKKNKNPIVESISDKIYIFNFTYDRVDYFPGYPSKGLDYEIRSYGYTPEEALDDLVDQAFDVSEKLGFFVEDIAETEMGNLISNSNSNDADSRFQYFLFLGFDKAPNIDYLG
jgi:hypothetical protein